MSPPDDAFVVVGSSRWPLSPEDPVIVPSGPVVLDLRDVPHAGSARLDGRQMPVAFDPATHIGTAGLNLTRATGYHQLQVGPERRYRFGTEDAKLRIDGVVEMLDYLREHADALGLTWSGTLQFSGTGQVLRDIRLDIAWLERHVGEAVALAEAIARRPVVSTARRYERTRRGVPSIPETARLIRRRPELMERHLEGLIEFGDERWAPREFVRERCELTHDTQGNRVVTRLLIAVLGLAYTCRDSAPESLRSAVQAHIEAVSSAIRLEPFASIRRRRGHLRIGIHPSTEECFDDRYRRARALLQNLLRDRHWDPRNQVSEEWAFAALADQVYQAFAAIVIARAFCLSPAAHLGQEGPHFASEDYEMWVDSAPPREVLHNWRDDTLKPSSLRPDITIHRLADGQVAPLDAKYRTNGARASSDSLLEVQLYLQAFGCRAVSVLFPPVGSPPRYDSQAIGNGHFNITEIPLRPMDDLGVYVESVVRPAVEATFHRPDPTTKAAVDAAAEEVKASALQESAVRTLVSDGEVVRLTQPAAMVPAENSLRRMLGEVWDGLGDDIQKMLITAEYFGDQVPEGFDHSGPVLGLFAACERLARDRLFGPSEAVLPGEYQRVTFGEAAEALRRLPVWRHGREQTLRRWVERQPDADVAALGTIGAAMLKVNRWRIAAAHAVLVDKATWDKSHTAVLDNHDGLLVRLCRALPGDPAN